MATPLSPLTPLAMSSSAHASGAGVCIAVWCTARGPPWKLTHRRPWARRSAVTLMTEQVEKLMYELSMWRASPDLKVGLR